MNPGQGCKVLVLDDDRLVLRAVSEILKRDGYDVLSVSDPVEAIAVMKDASIDVVVSDVKMPNLSGIDVLKAFKRERPEVEVILMTGHATIETAMEAVRAGAYAYLTKPFDRIEDLSLTVAKAVERRMLIRRADHLEEALTATHAFQGMLGQSAPMQAVFKLVQTVGPSDATVLIQGESGTGKELVARAIHFQSPRKAKPFLAVNCSALTDTLLESELFGHMKGAFTGAIGNKKGLFEAAHQGTLFLDEIGDISAATQVRLLRVLQEGEVKRVGGNESISVDVRVIAATNVNLEKAKAEGRFREDLFYRLNVIALQLPPLRDRPADVPLLAQHFLKKYGDKAGKPQLSLSSEAMKLLMTGRWSGNVRELENVMERAAVLAQGSVVDVADLPAGLREPGKSGAGDVDVMSLAHLPFAQAKALSINAFERRYLSALMERTGFNISQGALAAGMDRSNFRRLLKEHDILERTSNEA